MIRLQRIRERLSALIGCERGRFRPAYPGGIVQERAETGDRYWLRVEAIGVQAEDVVTVEYRKDLYRLVKENLRGSRVISLGYIPGRDER